MALVALVALGELGGHELRCRSLHHLAVEPAGQALEQFAVAPQEPRFQDGGPDRHVGLRQADALVHGAGGMADLQAEVPKPVEHELDHGLRPGRALVGEHEQEVDVGARRHRAAAVAADRHHRDALGLGGIVDAEDATDRHLGELPDQHILQEGEPLGTGEPAAVGVQQFAGPGKGGGACLPQPRDQGRAELRRSFAGGYPVDVGRQRGNIDQVRQSRLDLVHPDSVLSLPHGPQIEPIGRTTLNSFIRSDLCPIGSIGKRSLVSKSRAASFRT